MSGRRSEPPTLEVTDDDRKKPSRAANRPEPSVADDGGENLYRVVDHRTAHARVIRRPLDLTLTGKVQHLIDLATPLEVQANRLGIYNVFDDGGYRTLLLLTMFGLTKAAPGRLGDDAIDRHGHRFELKTINLINTKGELKTSYPGVTTEHTLRQENLERYRACDAWLIGVFKGNQPLDVWVLPSAKLEPFYMAWEEKIARAPNHELNNPKIPMGFVAVEGVCHKVPGSETVPRPRSGRFKMPGGDGSNR